ncbi:MAG: urease accessory protein UreE [Pseudomonadota bacterium]|nr:urease accessory protein UreE [Pseudomonadota bacterium]
MKLSLNTDFTKFPRAVSVAPAGSPSGEIAGKAMLAHDERHLRRRALELTDGGKVLVDLPEPVSLGDGDRLVLEDGRLVEIGAAPEELYDIRARDAAHMTELAWHIGSRHVAAAIEAGCVLIARDPAIRGMLEGLGATVVDVVEPFSPLGGVHSDHGHDHHHHDHHDAPGHGGRDAHGRLPGDPHYGHNHA